MSPYLKHLKNAYLKRIGCLPFQLLTTFLEPERRSVEGAFAALTRLYANANWYSGAYTKLIVRQSKHHFGKVQKDIEAGDIKPQYKDYQKTIRFMGQLLTPTDMEQFIKENRAMLDYVVDYFMTENPNNRDRKEKIEEIQSELDQLFQGFPLTSKTLNDLLTELPFQLFILVAQADESIDSRERMEFLKIIRDPEWCNSDCAHAFFNSTSYFFSEFLLQYHRGKIKKDIKQVKRTVRFINEMFKEEEGELIRTDLTRLAEEIARASGGFAGIMSVSKAEQAVLSDLLEIFSSEAIQGSA